MNRYTACVIGALLTGSVQAGDEGMPGSTDAQPDDTMLESAETRTDETATRVSDEDRYQAPRGASGLSDKQLVGKPIVNADGERYGHVERVVGETGERKMAVVEIDAVLDVDRQVLLPLDTLTLTPDDELLTALDEENLKAQPLFEPERYDETEEAE